MNTSAETTSHVSDSDDSHPAAPRTRREIPLRGSPAAMLFVSTIIAAHFNRWDALSELVNHLSPSDLDTPYSDALQREIFKAVAPLKANHEAVLSQEQATSDESVPRADSSHNVAADPAGCDLCPGDTALHLAARLASDDAVAVLLRAGANPELTNARGETPLDVATGPERALVWKLLSSARVYSKIGPKYQAISLKSFAERWLSAGNQKVRAPTPIVVAVA